MEDDTRHRIAFLVVRAYLAVLAFSVMTIAAYLLFTTALDPAAVRDLTGTMTAIVSGATGVLGFVLGYYFKAVETTASSPPQRRRTKKI
jgi:uncharacterized membrane protein